MELDGREIAVIAGFTIIGVIWAFLVAPTLTSASWFVTLNPVAAYLLYNIGWILLISTVFGGFVAHFVIDEGNILHMFRVGVATWIGFSFLFDMWEPPLYLSVGGKVLIPLGTSSLENTAVDAMTAYVWRLVLGSRVLWQYMGTSLWFVLVYVITPIIALFMMALILKPKAFMELLTNPW